MLNRACTKRYHFTILLLSISVIFNKAGARTGTESNLFTKFSLSVGAYLIDDFNTKIKAAKLKQRQDWVSPQIKDLKLVIPEHYTFTASNIFFIALGIADKHLEKTTLINSTLPPGSYKTSLDTSPLPQLFSLHCKQINKVKIELDNQPSSMLASMLVSNYEATFFPMHLVFLELDMHRPHLDFKIFDENNNEVIPRTFHLQLLNKNEYI